MTRCKGCKKPLRDPESIARGAGPTCARKLQAVPSHEELESLGQMNFVKISELRDQVIEIARGVRNHPGLVAIMNELDRQMGRRDPEIARA